MWYLKEDVRESEALKEVVGVLPRAQEWGLPVGTEHSDLAWLWLGPWQDLRLQTARLQEVQRKKSPGFSPSTLQHPACAMNQT